MLSRVLIVGCGLTGSLISDQILRLNIAKHVTIWEKSRGAGGRMATSRSPSNSSASVDIGAQYVTATPSYCISHADVYKDLLKAGILAEMEFSIEGSKPQELGTKNFVAPKGMNSIVKHFLPAESESFSCEFARHLSELKLTGDGSHWEACVLDDSPETQGSPGDCTFDAVVLTIPVGQILQLPGVVKECIERDTSLKTLLSDVTYSSRYALALFLPEGSNVRESWTAKYFPEDPLVRFISFDHRKRGAESSAPTILVHTSVPFGLEHLDDDRETVKEMIMDRVRQLLPDLPQTEFVKCHKWRYSQVHCPYSGTPGSVLLQGHDGKALMHDGKPLPTLLLAGDAFTHSNFDGCVTSAESAVRKLQEAKSAL